MTPVELRAFWSAFPTLDPSDPALAAELARRPVACWDPGTTLVRDGDVCSAAPLVLRGSLSLTKTAEQARQIELYALGPGECCPLTTSSLMGGDRFPATASVSVATCAVLVPAEAFVGLVASSPSFRRLAFGQLARRLGSVITLVEALAFQRLDQRLAALLAASPGEVRKTHQALADQLGSSREVVTRALREFERLGWIATKRGSVVVRDREGLRSLHQESSGL